MIFELKVSATDQQRDLLFGKMARANVSLQKS
jgi:hypothetical protein